MIDIINKSILCVNKELEKTISELNNNSNIKHREYLLKKCGYWMGCKNTLQTSICVLNNDKYIGSLKRKLKVGES